MNSENIIKAKKCLDEILKRIPEGDIEKNSIFNEKMTCSKTSNPEMVKLIEDAVMKYIKIVHDIDEEMVEVVCDTLKAYGKKAICAMDISLVKGTWDPTILNIYMVLLSKEIMTSIQDLKDNNITYDSLFKIKVVMAFTIKNEVFPKYNINPKKISFTLNEEKDIDDNEYVSLEILKCMYFSCLMEEKKFSNFEDIIIYYCFIPALKTYCNIDELELHNK